MHITGIIQDNQGYMWLASKNGLFKYDGYQMTHFKNNPLDQNSLGSDALESICIDRDGIIWIGTFNAGLDRFDPVTNQFTHYRHDPKDPSSIINDTVDVVFSDRNGTLWVGAHGLEKFDPNTNKFIHYRNKANDNTSISSNVVRAIYEDRKGDLWIGTGSVYGPDETDPAEGGLNKMNRTTGTFTRYKHDPNDPNSLINNKVRAIFEDSKGNFWVGTSGDGLHTMNRVTGKFDRHLFDPKHPEKLSRPALNKETHYDHITFIKEDTTGSIWIGTSEAGLNYYDPVKQRITHFESEKDTAGSYRDYTAWWAYTSREGVLWISSLHGSLYRVNPLQARVPFYPIPSNGVTSIYQFPDGNTLIGTGRDGVFQKEVSGTLTKKYTHDPDDPKTITSNDISFIKEDKHGDLWIGTFGHGLNLLNDKTGAFTKYIHDNKNENVLGNNYCMSLYEEEPGDLWIGTFKGINRFNKKKGTFRYYTFYPDANAEYGPNLVTTILKDRHSKWWAACWERGGVQQFDPETGKFKTYLKGASIINLLEDHAGILWASGREGLYRFDQGTDFFYRFDDLGFLSETSEVRNLLEDNRGNLWMTTSTGIVKVNAQRTESTLIGKSYGIVGTDFSFLSAYKNAEGKLFFGATGGYFSFFPDEVIQEMRPPEIVITSFKISNKLIEPNSNGPLTEPLASIKKIRLNHEQDVFAFGFVGIDYSNPEDNRHLFMLENYDQGWNLAGAERNAIYFNVPPGKYVFRVKVVNSYGIWAERNIEVIITPPWWSTWWFRIGAILFIAGVFYAFIRWRINQKFNRQLEQSEKDKQLAELRQKTGELEMQALRAQMNPHFVFNSLNAINRFILENNKTQASEYLTKFSRLVRMILQNSQSALITLESELESLKLYLELEALRFDHRFDYKISVPKDLDIDILKVPPLIIQPYAENAIWHGLMHKEEKGHLGIDIIQEQDHLIFKIKDDGIGRKQSAATTSKTATKHKSLGLKITADRIAMMQRSKNGQSPVVINDLENTDGSAAGTEVIIKIPVIYD